MIAADRAMYQAKSLGKNQISGNPRPRRSTQRRLLATAEEVSGQAPIRVATPVAVPSPVGSSAEPAATNRTVRDLHGDDEPDPADVRRQIAAARRNMDPDHQIRRAMDAFLSSPSARPGDGE